MDIIEAFGFKSIRDYINFNEKPDKRSNLKYKFVGITERSCFEILKDTSDDFVCVSFIELIE